MQLHIGYDPLRVDMPVIQLVRKEEIARTMLCMLGHLFLNSGRRLAKYTRTE